MTKVLITYFSASGNTRKMAVAVAGGARAVSGTEVLLKRVEETSLDNLKAADAIVIGSPTYYGLLAYEVKKLLDESVRVHGSLEGKVGAAFTSSGGSCTGAETTVISILQAMLVHGMIVQGDPEDKHYGVCCVGTPSQKDLRLCRRLGMRVANLANLLSTARGARRER
jgi:NAD(P)H dehydrogenase (quinone)